MKISKLPIWVVAGGILSFLFTITTVLSLLKFDMSGGVTRLLSWPATAILIRFGVTDTDPWLLYFFIVGNIVNFCIGALLGLLAISIRKGIAAKSPSRVGADRVKRNE
jgi:hypothetical protein